MSLFFRVFAPFTRPAPIADARGMKQQDNDVRERIAAIWAEVEMRRLKLQASVDAEALQRLRARFVALNGNEATHQVE